METYKIGDKFQSKTGRIYTIVSFTKNTNIITYTVVFKGSIDYRNGSLVELTKHAKIN